jgi:hypothetical protein
MPVQVKKVCRRLKYCIASLPTTQRAAGPCTHVHRHRIAN